MNLFWDRGSELSAHQDFTVATNIQVYFCDPSSPWQRGSQDIECIVYSIDPFKHISQPSK